MSGGWSNIILLAQLGLSEGRREAGQAFEGAGRQAAGGQRTLSVVAAAFRRRPAGGTHKRTDLPSSSAAVVNAVQLWRLRGNEIK